MVDGTFFQVTHRDLNDLTEIDAVEVIGDMLRAEAWVLGIPLDNVNVPLDINVADGGVDAEARDVPKNKRGLLHAGATRYQIKTGGFSLATNSDLDALFLKPKARKNSQTKRTAKKGKTKTKRAAPIRRTPENVSPRIKACLDHGGTLVVALFGSDRPDRTDRETEKRLQEYLARINSDWARVKVKVWWRNQITAFINLFPAIALKVKRRLQLPVLSHAEWSRMTDMRPTFVEGAAQEKFIRDIRDAVERQSPSALHLRICAEPGIGKTRLILEATRTFQISPLVVYAPTPEAIFETAAFAELLRIENISLVLIVDECSPKYRSQLTQFFGGKGGNLRIISIYQDRDEGDATADYLLFEPPPLEDGEIRKIIEAHGISDADAKFWAKECEGSPRVAHVIAENLRHHPLDPLHADGIRGIWTRYVAGADDLESTRVRRRLLVLQCLALFKRFGFLRHLAEEAAQIHKHLVVAIDPSITHAEYRDIIERLRKRKVLQGEATLYITPKLLHVRLWRDWWDNYEATVDIRNIYEALSSPLRKWFAEMIVYARESKAALRVIERLLGPDGLFADPSWVSSDEGSRLFFHLAQVDPTSALRCLEDSLGHWTHDELKAFKGGRRYLVYSLEWIAHKHELFHGAARLLLKLAVAENETWSNNASGIFADLFSLGYGPVASSEAPPADRIDVLLDSVHDASQAVRTLALNAFDRALSVHHWTKVGDFERQGLRKAAPFWQPKTYGELFDAFRLYWTSLERAAESLGSSDQKRAVDLLLSHARSFCSIPNVREMAVNTLDALAQRYPQYGEMILATVVMITHYDRGDLDGDSLKRLVDLRTRLTGADFPSLLRRYAGMDLLEDHFDDDGNHAEVAIPHLERLAAEAMHDLDVLRRELTWLVTPKAQNGYAFGRLLAIADDEGVAWPAIFEQWKANDDRSDFFIGGYLKGVYERAPSEWEGLIQAVSSDSIAQPWLPRLVWRSGMSSLAAKLITQLAEDGAFEPIALQTFAYGGTIRQVPDEFFRTWVDLLVSTNSGDAAIASLDLCSYRLYGSDLPVDGDLLVMVLTQPAFFDGSMQRRHTMAEHHWGELAKKLVDEYPQYGKPIVSLLLKNFGKSKTIVDFHQGEIRAVLDKIAGRMPTETWNIIAPLLGPPISTEAIHITTWLRGESGFHERAAGALTLLPPDAIWEWVREDPETRAPYLASFVPLQLHTDQWQTSMARQLLIRYGGNREVRRGLTANYYTEGWAGPASEHYAHKKAELLMLQTGETAKHVLLWFKENLVSLDSQIETERLREERGW